MIVTHVLLTLIFIGICLVLREVSNIRRKTLKNIHLQLQDNTRIYVALKTIESHLKVIADRLGERN